MCSAYPPLRHPWLDLLQALNVQDPWLTHLPHQCLSQSLAHSRCSFKKWLREGMDGERKRRRVKHQISGLPHLSPSLPAPLFMLVLVFNPETPFTPAACAHSRTLPHPCSHFRIPRDIALPILLPNGLQSYCLPSAFPPVFCLLCPQLSTGKKEKQTCMPSLKSFHNCSFSGRKKRETRFTRVCVFSNALEIRPYPKPEESHNHSPKERQRFFSHNSDAMDGLEEFLAPTQQSQFLKTVTFCDVDNCHLIFF